MAKIKINEKFTWDTDGLANYVDENNEELEVRMVQESRTVRLMRIQEGVKGTQKIQQLETTVTLQSATDCGFNASGDDRISPRQITTEDIKVDKSYCNKKIVGFWPQRKLVPGAQAELEDLPFESEIFDNVLAKHALIVGKLIWQGDKDSLDGNLNKIDGFLKLLAADADVIELNTSGAAQIDKDNVLELLQDGIDAMPQEIASAPEFGGFAPWTVMRKLMRNIGEANLFHYKIEALIDGEKQIIAIEIPGTLTKLYYDPGMDGADETFVFGLMGAKGDFVVATDTESDFTNIDMWYSKDNKELRLTLEYRLGVNYPFGDQIGIFNKVYNT